MVSRKTGSFIIFLVLLGCWLYFVGGVFYSDVIGRCFDTIVECEGGLVEQVDALDLAVLEDVVWGVDHGEDVICKGAIGTNVLGALGKIDSECGVAGEGAVGDDVVVIVCFDGVDACMGVSLEAVGGDVVVGGILEFYTVAILKKGAVRNGVVVAGIVWRSKEYDPFILAVVKRAVGNDIGGAPECDADGGVGEGAVGDGGVWGADFYRGGVQSCCVVLDLEVGEVDVCCGDVNGVSIFW